MPLHVSSNKCSSSGGPNCINTPSGMTHSGGWLSDVPFKRSVLYQIIYWHKLVLLMMSTCCSKHVEAWNKYIKKECAKLVINQKKECYFAVIFYVFLYRVFWYNCVMLTDKLNFSNWSLNSIFLAFYMFRTSYVRHQEDYIVHVALHAMYFMLKLHQNAI
jgi:hypothetical protein